MSLINPQPPLAGADLPPDPGIEDPNSEKGKTEDKWLRIARQAYESSSDWVDANLRFQWDKSLSLFNSYHPAGSKYNTDAYAKRSKFFRPKTRTAVRNLQSAMSVAFFTNEDVINVSARNPNDPLQAAAAVVDQSILQYRLTHTIPWFQTITAALQDAAVQGICVSHQYWDFEEKEESYIEVDSKDAPVVDMEGNPVVQKQMTSLNDKPVIELISPENIRIDPASDWADPMHSSPYVIHLIPMFIQDVVQKMDEGEWKYVDPTVLLNVEDRENDNATRLTRDEPRMDPLDSSAGYGEITDYKITWIHKNIVRKDGIDWCFFTAGTEHLLTDAKPLLEMYPWLRENERPYVMGYVNIEAHKIYPAGTVQLTQELQAAANEIWNQRFDNVKLVMNKRYHIRRDRNIDLDALFRSVPGGAVEMDDPDQDVRVIETRDVTSSAYAEQDRINMDFDELQGNFSTSTVQGARSLNETVGGMNLLAGNSSTVTEYVLRTFSESWVEKVLMQLLRLEQYYETDEVVLSVAGQTAQNKFEFDVDPLMDDLLRQDVLLKVNVGINATDPMKKIQSLMMGITALAELPGVVQTFNIPEIVKEVFGHLGFKDGSRFINSEADPQVQELQQQLQQMQAVIESKQLEGQTRMQVETLKQKGDAAVASIKAGTDMRIAQMRAELEYLDIQLKQSDTETRRGELMLQRDALVNQIAEQELERQSEMVEEGPVGVMARDDYAKIPYAVG